MEATDYQAVYQLWQDCNLVLGPSDTEDEIVKFINQNPQTSLVLLKNKQLIGSVLGGFDGRRGLVHHLAISENYRKAGYGRLLFEKLEDEFTKMGVVKISFWVHKSNLQVIDFYQKIGCELREDIITMSKTLRE